MRVYQFRHIRARRKCSPGWHRVADSRRTMRRLRRRLAPRARSLLGSLAVLAQAQPSTQPATAGATSSRSSSRCRSRRSRRRSSTTAALAAAATTPPQAEPARARGRLVPPHARSGAARRSQSRVDGRRSRPRVSAGTTASSSTGSPSSSPRSQLARLEADARRDRLAEVTYHSLLDQTPQLIGAPAVWGADARHRRPGDEDRDHRRRSRPDARLLRPGRASATRPASRRGTPRTRRRR